MNHRESPHLPAGMRRALRCLSLLIVPALALDESHATPGERTGIRVNAEPIPYLPVLGSPSLRIEEAPPPPDLVTRPASAAPPVPAATPAEASVAAANINAARSTTVATEEAPTESKAEPSAISPGPAPAAKTPPAILPDTTRPVIHPEDFLPYFQIPGSSSAPTPGPLPPSSATYTQTPR
jgi:hypothetical protein